jgi:predicted secreted Zn-dependent protease
MKRVLALIAGLCSLLAVPCRADGGDAPADIAVEAPPPIVLLRIEHYDIHGKTRPGAAGLALLTFSFSYETLESADICALRKVQVVLDGTLVVPSSASRSALSRLHAADVEGHERTHYEIAVKAANELTERLREAPPAQTCAQLAAELRRRKRDVEAHHWELQQEFHRRERL